MGRAYIRVFAVRRTEEISLFPLVIIHCAVIEFLPAVGAIEQTRKHADNPAPCRSAAVFPKLLHEHEGFFVNDCGMGVFKYLPFLLREFQPLLAFK